MHRRNPLPAAIAVCVAILVPFGSIAEFAGAEGAHGFQTVSILAASMVPSNVASPQSGARRSWTFHGTKQSPVQILTGTDVLQIRPSSGVHEAGDLVHQWQPGEARAILDRSPPDSAFRA